MAVDGEDGSVAGDIQIFAFLLVINVAGGIHGGGGIGSHIVGRVREGVNQGGILDVIRRNFFANTLFFAGPEHGNNSNAGKD